LFIMVLSSCACRRWTFDDACLMKKKMAAAWSNVVLSSRGALRHALGQALYLAAQMAAQMASSSWVPLSACCAQPSNMCPHKPYAHPGTEACFNGLPRRQDNRCRKRATPASRLTLQAVPPRLSLSAQTAFARLRQTRAAG